MNFNEMFDTPDALHKYRVMHGLHHDSGMKNISGYVLLVKVRKLIRSLTEEEIGDLNKIIFQKKLNKFNKWTRDKLLGKLDMMPQLRLMRVLYVREKEGIADALLCLLDKKKFHYAQNFLTNWFKYGTALDS